MWHPGQEVTGTSPPAARVPRSMRDRGCPAGWHPAGDTASPGTACPDTAHPARRHPDTANPAGWHPAEDTANPDSAMLPGERAPGADAVIPPPATAASTGDAEFPEEGHRAWMRPAAAETQILLGSEGFLAARRANLPASMKNSAGLRLPGRIAGTARSAHSCPNPSPVRSEKSIRDRRLPARL